MGALGPPPGPGATDVKGSPISLATAWGRLFKGSNCRRQQHDHVQRIRIVDVTKPTVCTGVNWKRERYLGALDQGHAGQLLDLQTLVVGAVEWSLDMARRNRLKGSDPDRILS